MATAGKASPPSAGIKSELANDAHIPHVRNVGIVAHIDAGKTTTTERMLFFTGESQRLGDVDSGTTTTDYLEEEMQRGITITAAAVSFLWKGHQINLIDTPGHIDFALEVERSLRVLDGVVALFDAAIGVQAQSYTVLRQAKKHGVPVIAYINKMDKATANFERALRSIQTKLAVEPALLQVPLLRNDGEFLGVIDLIKMKALRFQGKQGTSVVETPIEQEQAHNREACAAGRHQLLTALSARDDAIAERLIAALEAFEGDELKAEASLSEAEVVAAVRRQILASAGAAAPLVPILCGASRRDLAVQPLMDAVNAYLPSPLDKRLLTGKSLAGEDVPLPPPSSEAAQNLLALAFKVVHLPDPVKHVRRPLVFFRVYCGRIERGQEVTVQRTGKREKVEQLFLMHANDPRPVGAVGAGRIAAAFLNEAVTGDTLFREGSTDSALRLRDPASYEKVRSARCHLLEGIEVPPPVVSFALEPETEAQVPLTETALTELQREDPSFRWSKNDFGQIVVSGMGELHLEIIVSRLLSQYQLQSTLAKAIIEYRETISATSQLVGYRCDGPTGPLFTVRLQLSPLRLQDSYHENEIPKLNNVVFVFPEQVKQRLAAQLLDQAKKKADDDGRGLAQGRADKSVSNDVKAVEMAFGHAVRKTATMGPLARLRMVGVMVTLDEIHLHDGIPPLTDQVLSAASASCVNALFANTPHKALAEPMMEVEVHLSETGYLSSVVGDLNEREPSLVEQLDDGLSVRALVPFRRITRYISHLRRLARGNAYYFSQLHHYRVIGNSEVHRAVLAQFK